MRRAFTLLELVFVVVLLGILGAMGSDIITRTYENYLFQKNLADLQAKSKLLADQISGHLNRAVKPSLSRFDGASHQSIRAPGTVNDANRTHGNYLEWIGKDTESMRGIWNGSRIYPGYSGLANLRESNETFVVTTDCNLSYIKGGAEAGIPESITGYPAEGGGSALYFVHANSGGDVQSRFWITPTSLFRIAALDGNQGIITLGSKPPEMGEHYYLTYSAYGLQLEDDGKMYLYWNFRPWNGENIAGGQKLLMMEEVVSFSYWSESEDTLFRFRVCLTSDWDDYQRGQVPEFCKEGVVLR